MGGKFIPTAVFLTTLLGVVACSGSNSNDGNTDPGTQMPGQTADNVQGWQSIDMIADEAETKLDSLGHFDTSRNACGEEAFGTLDLTLWNNIVTESNQAMATPPLPEDHLLCFDAPEGNLMDGTVNYILDPSTTTSLDHAVPAASPAPTPSHAPNSSPTPHPSSSPTSSPTSRPSASPSPSPSPSASPLPSRSMFEAQGAQICTSIQDEQLAIALLNNINTWISLADKQNCANGYGSN
jgi:hypothetical protein